MVVDGPSSRGEWMALSIFIVTGQIMKKDLEILSMNFG